MASDSGGALSAWVDYYRDLGVYDFYRRGAAPAPMSAVEASAAVDEAVIVVDQAAQPLQAAPPVAVVSMQPPASVEKPSSRTPPELAVPQPSQLLSFDQLAPMPATPVPVTERAAALEAIQKEIGDCTRCPLAYAGRHKIVFGDGAPGARLMFIGEGPGADEDAQGLPFVGRAGQLLNNMIGAMGLKREEVYIANIVKCRPPGNRVPEPVEAQTCSQFLLRQIDVVQPEVIVALGSTAATYLLGVRRSLSALRGRWHSCRGAKLAVTYHPAFLLRDPRQKAEAWKDLQMVMAEMGLKAPAKKPS
ncbi:MAG TPA: uracil-DNA glycosylase family protein [Acidobacteriaceae bacterium]|nr:uracil-DNA glycosylase family protein [Acidobacteriaceae bacterium]